MLLTAGLLGCQQPAQDRPPLVGLDDQPSSSPRSAPRSGPARTPGSAAAGGDTVKYACEVGKIMRETTDAALPKSTDAAALAGLYREAATKIRGVADQAAGTPIARSITDVAVAVDAIARHFGTGSLDPPDGAALAKSFDGLPLCRQG
jgi:hypothetical protein